MPTIENKTGNPEESAFHGIAEGEGSIALYGQGGAVGVRGDGSTWDGVAGISTSTTGGAGVHGINDTGGSGVIGESTVWMGVYGKTDSATGGAGVMGEGVGGGPGVIGKSQHWHGTYGETSAPGEVGAAGVWGEHKNNGSGVVGVSQGGAGIYGKSTNGAAGVFDGRLEVRGDIEVSGDIRLLNGDVAELFDGDCASSTMPGMVVSVDDDGQIAPSGIPYDRKVVGIVAGAGEYRPGLVLDSRPRPHASPVAMVGKVHCHADATYGPIAVGDLLTTSPRPGHVMRAADPARAFGAVVGKALGHLEAGQGLIPVIVALQ